MPTDDVIKCYKKKVTKNRDKKICRKFSTDPSQKKKITFVSKTSVLVFWCVYDNFFGLLLSDGYIVRRFLIFERSRANAVLLVYSGFPGKQWSDRASAKRANGWEFSPKHTVMYSHRYRCDHVNRAWSMEIRNYTHGYRGSWRVRAIDNAFFFKFLIRKRKIVRRDFVRA